MSCEWLPDLMLFEAYSGNWEIYLEELYKAFTNDFINAPPRWPNKRVGVKRHPEHAGKSATFWHIISTGESEQDRIPDFRRCERIKWPRPLMDEYSDNHAANGCANRIIWWQNERKGETRYLLSPLDFSYVFVVADRGEFVLPWTAYYVEHTSRRRKYQKEYEEYWKPK